MITDGTLRQISTFALVGGAATAAHLGSALVANQYFGLPPLSSNLVGYTSAVLISYLGNARFTFKRPTMNGAQFARFLAVSLLALALNQAIIYYCSIVLGWDFVWALIPVAIVVPLFSFVMSRVWAFVDRATPSER